MRLGNHVHYFDHVPPHGRVAAVAESVVSASAGQPDLEDQEFAQDFLQFRSPMLDAPGVRALARQFRDGGVEQRLEALVGHINSIASTSRAVQAATRPSSPNEVGLLAQRAQVGQALAAVRDGHADCLPDDRG